MICFNCNENSISASRIIIKRYSPVKCPSCSVTLRPVKDKKIILLPKITIATIWLVVAWLFNIGKYGDFLVYSFLMIGVFLGFFLEIFLNNKFGKLEV